MPEKPPVTEEAESFTTQHKRFINFQRHSAFQTYVDLLEDRCLIIENLSAVGGQSPVA